MTESADPLLGLAVFPVVTDIVVHADPGAIEAIDEFDELIRALFRGGVMVVEHFVPDIFDQDALAKRCGEGQEGLDFLAASVDDFVGGSVAGAADDDEDATTAGGVGEADAVGDIGDALGTVCGIGAGEAFAPVVVVNGIVDEDAGCLGGGAGLFEGEAAGLVEVDAIESGFTGEGEAFREREFFAVELFGEHSEFGGDEDAVIGAGVDGLFGWFIGCEGGDGESGCCGAEAEEVTTGE